MKQSLIILFFISISSCAQTSKKLTGQITLVHGTQFKGVVFSSDYKVPILDETLSRRFTPTLEEIRILEKQLQSRIKDINKNRTRQGRHYGSVVHRSLRKYIRQYVGFINDHGEKIIYIGFHRHSRDYKWRENFVLVFDGGSRHWTIRYNVDKNEFSNFSVNGVAMILKSCRRYALA